VRVKSNKVLVPSDWERENFIDKPTSKVGVFSPVGEFDTPVALSVVVPGEAFPTKCYDFARLKRIRSCQHRRRVPVLVADYKKDHIAMPPK